MALRRHSGCASERLQLPQQRGVVADNSCSGAVLIERVTTAPGQDEIHKTFERVLNTDSPIFAHSSAAIDWFEYCLNEIRTVTSPFYGQQLLLCPS